MAGARDPRPFVELLVAQLAILVATPALATLIGALGALAGALYGPVDPQGTGLGPAAGFVFGWLVGLPVVYGALWVLAWWWRFRYRMHPLAFLLGWAGSALALGLLWLLWDLIRTL